MYGILLYFQVLHPSSMREAVALKVVVIAPLHVCYCYEACVPLLTIK
jgi:hypothetical protein